MPRPQQLGLWTACIRPPSSTVCIGKETLPQCPRRTMLFFLTLLVIAASYVPVLPASFVADDYTIYSPEFLSRPRRYFYQSLWAGQDVPKTGTVFHGFCRCSCWG